MKGAVPWAASPNRLSGKVRCSMLATSRPAESTIFWRETASASTTVPARRKARAKAASPTGSRARSNSTSKPIAAQAHSRREPVDQGRMVRARPFGDSTRQAEALAARESSDTMRTSLGVRMPRIAYRNLIPALIRARSAATGRPGA